jgi:hypothetical protein
MLQRGTDELMNLRPVQTVVSTDGKIFVYELLETGASCLKVIDGLVAPSKSE